MFAKFLSLDKEKQDRIINAAMKEFAQKGYDKASTNEMVKEAGISKGLLFHYFQNKKQLYFFLYDHMTKLLVEQIEEKVDKEERDLFIRVRQMALVKLEIFQMYPELFNFAKSIFMETSAEVIHEVGQRGKELLESYFKDFKGDIDFSKFKKGIDVNKAFNIIAWTLEGFGFQQQKKVQSLSIENLDIEEALKEMDEYLDMLRNAFYE